MTTELAPTRNPPRLRRFPTTVLRGSLLAVALPAAVVGTLIQTAGFLAFSASGTVERAHN